MAGAKAGNPDDACHRLVSDPDGLRIAIAIGTDGLVSPTTNDPRRPPSIAQAPGPERRDRAVDRVLALVLIIVAATIFITRSSAATDHDQTFPSSTVSGWMTPPDAGTDTFAEPNPVGVGALPEWKPHLRCPPERRSGVRREPSFVRATNQPRIGTTLTSRTRRPAGSSVSTNPAGSQLAVGRLPAQTATSARQTAEGWSAPSPA
jgi:hypothetical protein